MSEVSSGPCTTGGQSSGDNAVTPAFLDLVVSSWSDVNLEETRPRLDDESMRIVDASEVSKEARKNLALLYQDLRNTGKDDRLKKLPAVLKAYQHEIDALTRRSNQAEKSFLKLYKSLADAPDPTRPLQAAKQWQEQLVINQEQLRAAKASLAEYDEEFATLKNQDYTIKRLEDEVASLRDQTEERIDARLQQQKVESNEANEIIFARFRQREDDLKVDIGHHKAQVQALQEKNSRAQERLLELSIQKEQQDSSVESAHDTLLSDLERVRAEAESLRREKAELRAAIDRTTGSQSKPTAAISLTPFEIQKLRDSVVDAAQRAKSAEEESVASQQQVREATAESERVRVESAAAIDDLKRQMATLPSLDEFQQLRKRLHLLQSLEFNAVADDSISGSDEQSAQSEMNDTERMLFAKTRKLEAELTKTKLELLTSAENLSTTQTKLDQSLESGREQDALIARLEQDLEKVNQCQPPTTPQHATSSSMSSLGGVLSAENSTSSEPAPTQQESISKTVEPTSPAFAIVCGQRDRFRKKVQEMAKERAALQAKLDIAHGESSRLRDDNLSLYRKLKYVEHFQSESQQSNQHSGGSGSQSIKQRRPQYDLEAATHDAVEKKYEKLYEAKHNPFAEFTRQEHAQRTTNMGFAERITLRSARLFLSARPLRLLLFGYALLLHVLVFTTLYTHTIQDHCAQHQINVHAPHDIGAPPIPQ